MTAAPSAYQQRCNEAGLRLVLRGLLEGPVGGALLGPSVLWASTLIGLAFDPASGVRAVDLVAGVVFGSFAVALFTAPLGLAGGGLALVTLGLVAHWQRDRWTTSTTAWVVPAIAVGVATAVLGVVAAGWVFYAAAVPAAVLTGWRVRRAITRFVTEVGAP